MWARIALSLSVFGIFVFLLSYVTSFYNFFTCPWYLTVTSVSASPEKYKKLCGLGDGFTQLDSTVDTHSRVSLRSFCDPS